MSFSFRSAVAFPVTARIAGAAALAASLLFSACTKEPAALAGGWTDTETGPKVAGIIKREDGTGAAGALVLLRPTDYLGRDPSLPESLGVTATGGSVIDALCDSSGAYSFDSVGIGSYVLESRDREIKAVSVRFGVERPKGRFTLPNAIVRAVGSVTGRVRFSDGTSGRVLVRIFGLERAVITDAAGAYFFSNLPAGAYSLHFSGIDPFILPADQVDIHVASNAATDAGEITMQRRLKQAFEIKDGSLALTGVDSTNPLVFENGAFRNAVDGAYLWAKASMGHLDLRGTIVTYGKDTGEAAIRINMASYARLSRTARNSGIRGMVEAVAGARRMLTRAPGGRLEDIRPDTSDGALLLIREAKRATPAKPLVFISGANLTTAAEALLLDPSIADRMVIFGANNGNYNNGDSLALAVVVKKARFVAWARDYIWPVSGIKWNQQARIPTNPLGADMRYLYHPDSVSGPWAFAFYGDFGASTFLFNRNVWSSARAMDLKGPPLLAEPSIRPDFDFIDIAAASNNWDAIQEEFFSTIASPAAYHAWPLPGQIEAEAYQAVSGVTTDSSAEEGEWVAAWKGAGSFADYRVQVDKTGDYVMEFRYRSAVASGLKLVDAVSGDSVVVDPPATLVWSSVKADVHLTAGDRILRLESAKGPLELNWVRTTPK